MLPSSRLRYVSDKNRHTLEFSKVSDIFGMCCADADISVLLLTEKHAQILKKKEIGGKDCSQIKDLTSLSYWLNWRVLSCVVWVLTPMIIVVLLIWKYEHSEDVLGIICVVAYILECGRFQSTP
ncbi:uncharacterized protein LOC127244974 [Andrographis paniculata]|uniref:uncharacterized protein LOC127244974 n=1 Tax=Andrographis paniculata TaxID=175694 RepID=UPI0021E867DF|nr:uncharacterized protein LOC127244974 [Andrographis paniculata]